MLLKRATAFCFCVLTFALAFVLGQTARYLGFPDGYLTELDGARKLLYETFSRINIALGIYFLYLGLRLRQPSKGRHLLAPIVVLGGLVAIAVAVDCTLPLYLDRGQGG